MEKRLSRQEREKIGIERTILQHAEDLFRINGYENTTMGMLAKSCEYTTRTIYRYFSCKEDLYFAVLLKGHIVLLETVNNIAQSENSAKEKITIRLYPQHDFFFSRIVTLRDGFCRLQQPDMPLQQNREV